MTSVKPEHLPHVAIQAHVLRGAGITVRRTELMHLSRACRHPDLSNLFEREDVGAEVGDHCHEPHDCPFLKRCWPEPSPHAIETLYRMRRGQREEYATERYRTLLDLPDDAALTAIQDRQRRAARLGGLVVDPGLADGPGDPREAIARRLIEFTDGARTILAYNASFEARCIQALAEHLPRLAAKLGAVESRLRDLLPLIRDHLYHPAFNGSFGLKSVAPPLVPEIGYDSLEIAEGGQASRMLHNLLLKGDGMKEADRQRLRRDLLRYCRTDTAAIVGLHRVLAGLVRR